MARENKTQYAILGCLSKYKKMSGYDIRRVMEKLAASYWAESNAQLYPLLKKLTQSGMITMIEDSEGPRKRYLYSITPEGKNKLLDWLTETPTDLPIQRNEWLLKLSLGQHLEQSDILNHINQYLNQLLKRKEKLTQIQAHIETEHQGKPDKPYLVSTYRYGELVLEAQISWCHEMLEYLKNA